MTNVIINQTDRAYSQAIELVRSWYDDGDIAVLYDWDRIEGHEKYTTEAPFATLNKLIRIIEITPMLAMKRDYIVVIESEDRIRFERGQLGFDLMRREIDFTPRL